MRFYVTYGTGAGNFEFNGSLEECKKEADDGTSYTGLDVEIYDYDDYFNTEPVTPAELEKGVTPIYIRSWCNGLPSEEERSEDDIIEFGWAGYYTGWIEI